MDDQQQQEPKTVDLSVSLVNAVLQYLSTQPYAEVANLIGGITQEAQVDEQAEEAP